MSRAPDRSTQTERFAKLDEWILIQMLMHGQMVQIVPRIIRIAGLRVDTIHLIVVLSYKMLDRHGASNASPLF
jgi:hypothetical protein